MSEPVEGICRKIVSDALASYERRIDEALADANSMIDRVSKELERKLQQKESRLSALADAEYKSRVAKAKMSAQDEVLAAREEVRKQLEQRVRQELLRFPTSPRYPVYVRKSLLMASGALGQAGLLVMCRKEDARLVESLCRELGLGADLELVDIAGGVVVSKKDGAATVNLSLEERLKAIEFARRSDMEKALFGGSS
ncbi:MAG: V-type ATP synthase subunit E [Thermoprotei archaeon]|nr:V-type ATP synthase subunit E [TACK group archaeon]